MYLADIFTVHANLAGVPAISVPFGKDNQHMPIGIQIVSNYFSENQLLSFAKYLLNLQQQEAIID
jgi:aspartyl-tRNA(Asn)/glutamyl-tRNA(Gln) amidotransferase subunit A